MRYIASVFYSLSGKFGKGMLDEHIADLPERVFALRVGGFGHAAERKTGFFRRYARIRRILKHHALALPSDRDGFAASR